MADVTDFGMHMDRRTALRMLAASSVMPWRAAAAVDGSARIVLLPDIPDAVGRAGMFAGVHDGVLLAAGGANFPDRMPWEGGTKVWHDEVYALRNGGTAWHVVGRLPSRNGYGVSASTERGVLIVGGSDASRHRADAWVMTAVGSTVAFRALPSLPHSLAQMTGALVGRTLHIVGGIERPDSTSASAAHYAIDTDALARGWQPLPPLPGGGRILATSAAIDGALYVVGGCTLHAGPDGRAARTYRPDGWRYRDGRWTPIAPLPMPLAASASPAPVVDGRLLVVGGDAGRHVGVSPGAHPGFSRRLLAYDPVSDRWHSSGDLSHDAPVTLPTAPWSGGHALVSGEVRPGVRTPRVLLVTSRD